MLGKIRSDCLPLHEELSETTADGRILLTHYPYGENYAGGAPLRLASGTGFPTLSLTRLEIWVNETTALLLS
jgi:hypothetical protein